MVMSEIAIEDNESTMLDLTAAICCFTRVFARFFSKGERTVFGAICFDSFDTIIP